jgi:integrase
MAGIERLTALECKNASAPKKLYDGGNLILAKRTRDAGKWLFKYTIAGRERSMGLGPWPTVSLSEARSKAKLARADKADGKDPLREKRRRQKQALAETLTFQDCAEQCFDSRKAKLKGKGEAGGWWAPIKTYALPKLGGLPVADIDQHDVTDVLRPIWREKHPTAKKVAMRVNIILRYGAALGLDTDISAVEKARLILGDANHKEKRIPATPWQKVPDLYSRIDPMTHGSAGLLLQMLILTAGTRSAEVRMARWEHYDPKTRSLLVPAEHNKATTARRIPLSTHAVSVLDQAKPLKENGWIFPGGRGGAAHMNMAVSLLNRLGEEGRGHGFRSSFKQWSLACGHATTGIDEVCLDHRPDSKVVEAYARIFGEDAIANNTDLLEQRRALWQAWGDHVTGSEAKVIEMVSSEGANK